MGRKRKARGSRLERLARAVGNGLRRAVRGALGIWWRLARKLFQRPALVVLADGPHSRHLRGVLTRATKTYARALGAQLPGSLAIVVQKVVYEGRQLNGLLQAIEAPDGQRRYVLHLALSVNGRQVSDAELVAALRHELGLVLRETAGELVTNLPIDLEVPRVRAGAPIVERRAETNDQTNDERRSPMPFQRTKHDQAA